MMGLSKTEGEAVREGGNRKAIVFQCFLICSLLGAATLPFGFGRVCRHWVMECDASQSSWPKSKSVLSSTTFRGLWQSILTSCRRTRSNSRKSSSSSSFDQWFHVVEKQRRIRMQRIYSKRKFSNPLRFEHQNSQQHPLYYTSWSEPLVHPAMLSHSSPKRIAVIGRDQNSSTLKEVLKYNSVESVTIIVQEDKGASLELLDCNELSNKITRYADDPRVKQHKTKNAVTWLADRYGTNGATQAEKYDVVFLEPTATDQSKKGAHCDTSLIDVLSEALRDNGILVICVHSALPAKGFNNVACEDDQIKALQEAGFEYLTQYSEASFGTAGKYNFVIAFMHEDDRHRWYRNQAEIDLSIKKLAVSASSEGPPLDFFDGASMMTYQYPSRLVEERFCSTKPTSQLCDQGHGFDPERPKIPVTDLTVKPSTIPNAGRGLFFIKSVSKDSYLATEEEVDNILVMPSTYAVHHSILDFESSGPWNIVNAYIMAYGFCNHHYGALSWSVDAGILTFMNHGCNGTYNINSKDDVTEMNANPDKKPERDPMEESVYNPFLERNHLIFMHGYDVTNTDVEAGGEVLGNYMDYIDDEHWREEVEYLKAQCLGQDVGEVTEYEEENKKI